MDLGGGWKSAACVLAWSWLANGLVGDDGKHV